MSSALKPITNAPLKIAIIGGGAAGFFAAITAAEANPDASVTIYERGKEFLSKVKISGGGRCNVTHSCFDVAELATHYPRGSRELRGAFHRWQPQDTINWFAERGVMLKTEADGRMFPTTDDSQTIISCFRQTADRLGVHCHRGLGVKQLKLGSGGRFSLELSDGTQVQVDRLCIATGSLKASPLTHALESFGHTVEPLAPSLFAFNLADKRTHGLAGLSVQAASITIANTTKLAQAATRKGKASKPQQGPILITHRGLSGPAVLRLSAWEARTFQKANYHLDIAVNWLGSVTENQLRDRFCNLRKNSGKNLVRVKVDDTLPLPRRLWERLVEHSGITNETTWAQLPKDQETRLINELVNGIYSIQGKTTNKDEFVTCGGVKLKEVDFRTMESKIVPHLYFAGECLDIDGITGGFNFQAAWTGGRIAGEAMANE